ncbi:UNVERIFIED_CONTAM: hypothetical protein K2H54_042875 [Gekko kuhli]
MAPTGENEDVLIGENEEEGDSDNIEIGQLTTEQFKKFLLEEIRQAVETTCKDLHENAQSLYRSVGDEEETLQTQQSKEEERNCSQGIPEEKEDAENNKYIRKMKEAKKRAKVTDVTEN